jgi:hypothetical protein
MRRSRRGKDGRNNGDKKAEKLLCSNPHMHFQHNLTFTCVQVVLSSTGFNIGHAFHSTASVDKLQ